MKYCVIKDTTRAIAQSEDMDVLITNGNNAVLDGVSVEFEILTEEEYQERKALEPQTTPEPTDKERLEALELAMLEVVLGG